MRVGTNFDIMLSLLLAMRACIIAGVRARRTSSVSQDKMLIKVACLRQRFLNRDFPRKVVICAGPVEGTLCDR